MAGGRRPRTGLSLLAVDRRSSPPPVPSGRCCRRARRRRCWPRVLQRMCRQPVVVASLLRSAGDGCHEEGRMGERLGLGVIPGAGWSATEIQELAREADAAGFDAILVAEVNNDA